MRSNGTRQSLVGPLLPCEINQAAALCYRQRDQNGVIEVRLVGGLKSGRWGLPKGHIEQGETTSAAAEREAFEEAGVQGTIDPSVFGTFTYSKDNNARHFKVQVHLLGVNKIADAYPEKLLRKAKWFPIEAAIREVELPGLSEALRKLRLIVRLQNGTA